LSPVLCHASRATPLIRLYQIHNQEQEIALEKVSGTLRHQVFAEFFDASKVPDTNGTVVVLRARNVAYWRTVDFCKLPFARVGID